MCSVEIGGDPSAVGQTFNWQWRASVPASPSSQYLFFLIWLTAHPIAKNKVGIFVRSSKHMKIISKGRGVCLRTCRNRNMPLIVRAALASRHFLPFPSSPTTQHNTQRTRTHPRTHTYTREYTPL